jgi:hypothetical protein
VQVLRIIVHQYLLSSMGAAAEQLDKVEMSYV